MNLVAPTKPILLLFLIVLALPAWGQYHATHTYSTRDGLLSIELFHVFSDSRGRVWTSSVSGVSCFDGKSIQNFTVEEGLWSNSVDLIFEDGEGRIWMRCQDALEDKTMASVWDGTGMETIDIGYWIGKQPNGKLFWNKYEKKVQYFTMDELWTFDPGRKVFFLEATLPCELQEKGYANLTLDPFQNRFLVLIPHPDKAPLYIYTWKDGEVESFPAFHHIVHFTNDPLGSLPGGELLLRTTEKVWWLDPERGWQPFLPEKKLADHPGFAFLPDRYIFAQENENGQIDLIEINASAPRGVRIPLRIYSPINHASRAPDGTYWANTRSGLLHIFPAFIDFPGDDQHPYLYDLHTICEDRRGNIWFGSYSYGFSRFNGKEVLPGPGFLKPYFCVLPGSARDDRGNMYFWIERTDTAPDTLRGLIRFDGVSPPVQIVGDTVGYYVHLSYDGQMGLGMNRHGLGIIDPKQPESKHMEVIGTERGHSMINVLTTVKDRYGRWWMGRVSAGMALYEPVRDTVFTWLIAEKEVPFGVISSAMDSRGNLWFGTTEGLYFFPNGEDIDWARFDPGAELIPVGLEEMGTSTVMAMAIYDEHTLIAGNRKGIALIDLKSFYETGQALVYFMSPEDGYTGNGTDQNCILVDGNRKVWLASDFGAHRFDPALFQRNEQPPALVIDSLVFSGRTYLPGATPGKEIRLRRSRENADLRIILRSEPQHIRNSHLSYYYRFSTDSLFSKAGTGAALHFPNLAPGHYTLELKARRDGLESEVQQLRFFIPPPMWSTPWPYLVFLLLFAAGLWSFYRNQSRQRMEKNMLRVQAVINQLNPHFINNALTWVQVQVYKEKDAVAVISKLGENIRLVFRNTREKRSFHTLKDELKLVENYLFIQERRFGKHLSYSLPDPKEVEALGWIHVPLMQVQIHCENAVEHGIRNKEEPGFLSVKLLDEEPYLHIIVEDNGVGRKRAGELGSKGTQQGTQMLESLRDILNPHNSLPIIYQYDDDIFTNEPGAPYGTRVHMWIPKDYRYEFQ